SSSKRRSILSPISNAGPQAPVNASSSAKVSDNSILTGTHSITIQSESVIHPRARLESTSGSILVGRRCIVHERTHVGSTDGDETSGGVVLGDYVTVESGSVVEAGGTEIGEGTVVGVKARIGRGAKVGKNCTITPLSTVKPGETIPDFTVIYSNGRRRTDKRGVTELQHKAQARHVEVLKRLIPNNPAR
ncbi:hypothetical protein ACRALDRAFT_2084753, partial [Sodiomyces alcalophilus JCM 7366]|uniref:uncharacterized protein n=1 Tax=Sodiomyces alcalophilus JCM 7366 TaxID=591952 RepID=UPI0039B36F07